MISENSGGRASWKKSEYGEATGTPDWDWVGVCACAVATNITRPSAQEIESLIRNKPLSVWVHV